MVNFVSVENHFLQSRNATLKIIFNYDVITTFQSTYDFQPEVVTNSIAKCYNCIQSCFKEVKMHTQGQKYAI